MAYRHSIELHDEQMKILDYLGPAISGPALKKALVQIATPVKKTMKRFIPKRTGITRRAVGHRQLKVDHGALVFVGVKYKKTTKKRKGNESAYRRAIFLERGTKHMKAQPFVERSADINAEKTTKQLRAFVEKQIDKQIARVEAKGK